MNDHITSAHFDLWQTIRSEAAAAAAAEPMLASFLHLTVLRHHSLDRVLAFHLSSKLSSPIMDARALFEVYLQALQSDGDIIKAVEKDILACYERDPTNIRCPCFISKASMPCRPTASTIGCGSKAAKPWPISCKTAHLKCSAPTSTPPPASATA